MATIQEGGAVVVWVNGQSYSAQYPPNESAASLAVALAAEMNSPSSLIFATVPVNGNTIIITANVNGAATNYPLSTSFGFNTSNFSSPAFQATASGPSLTGGVD
jgi:phage tail sheath gpL-like